MRGEHLGHVVGRGVDEVHLDADLLHVLLEQLPLVVGGGHTGQQGVVDDELLAVLGASATLGLPPGLVELFLGGLGVVLGTTAVVGVAVLTGHEEVVAEHHRGGIDRQTGEVGTSDGLPVQALGDGLTDVLVLQRARLGVEGDVSPLRGTCLTQLAVVTFPGRFVGVLGDDVVDDVDLLVREGLGHGGRVHGTERDGVELGLLTPPVGVSLEVQGLLGLVDAVQGERTGEPLRFELLPAVVERLGGADALLGHDAAPRGGPVGVGGLVGDDDVGVLVALLHRLDLVETVRAGHLEVLVGTVVGLPGGLVVGVVDGAPGVPPGLRVEVQGDDLLAAIGLHVVGLQVVGVGLGGAVLGDVEVVRPDETHDGGAEIHRVTVDVQGVPRRRQGLDGEPDSATVLDLVTGLDVEVLQWSGFAGRSPALARIRVALVLLATTREGQRADRKHGDRCCY